MNIKATLISFFGDVGRFLAILFKKAIHDELAIALPIAANAVRQIAADPSIISNADKRDAAVSNVLAEVGKAQVSVGLGIVNLAVELAVQEFKAAGK